jgi:CubicO group peptidase (beta-lactamase class C family)
MMTNTGGYLMPGEWDSPRALEAVLPSTGLAANARSLAGMYRAIVKGGAIGRFQIGRDDIARMGSIQSAVGEDQVLFGPGRWTFGFHTGAVTPRRVRPPTSVVLGPSAFGHTGFGGSIGFADPDADLSFAYVMNQMRADMGLAETGQSLVDATYRALGFHRSKYGDMWVRSGP